MNKDYLKIFEEAACKDEYDVASGLNAVVVAVLDHVHDNISDDCINMDDFRQELVNYSLRFVARS